MVYAIKISRLFYCRNIAWLLDNADYVFLPTAILAYLTEFCLAKVMADTAEPDIFFYLVYRIVEQLDILFWGVQDISHNAFGTPPTYAGQLN